MTRKEVELKDKREVADMVASGISFDVTMREHCEKLDSTIKALKRELDAIKDVAKARFGEEGGNGVFSTRTTTSYLLNEAELVELIGADAVKALKTRESKKTYVEW